jgi:hypothetical protein
MVIKKAASYDNGVQVPAPGDDYPSPTPRQAVVSHHPYEAPAVSAAPNASDGTSTDHVTAPARATKPGQPARAKAELPNPRS